MVQLGFRLFGTFCAGSSCMQYHFECYHGHALTMIAIVMLCMDQQGFVTPLSSVGQEHMMAKRGSCKTPGGSPPDRGMTSAGYLGKTLGSLMIEYQSVSQANNIQAHLRHSMLLGPVLTACVYSLSAPVTCLY
jgi:hypothetical protein